jgi:hypothetical protein
VREGELLVGLFALGFARAQRMAKSCTDKGFLVRQYLCRLCRRNCVRLVVGVGKLPRQLTER